MNNKLIIRGRRLGRIVLYVILFRKGVTVSRPVSMVTIEIKKNYSLWDKSWGRRKIRQVLLSLRI